MNKIKQALKRTSFALIAAFFVSALVLNLVRVPKANATADTVYSDADQIDLTGDDNTSAAYDLPFNFNFYSTDTAKFSVSTNGYINLYDSEDAYQGRIDVLNDDLYMFGDAKSIYTKVLGEAPNRQFVIQWTNLTHCCDPWHPVGTFQVILSETTDNIQMQYLYQGMGEAGNGAWATIGLFNESDLVEIYSSDSGAVLSPRKAILFVPLSGTTYVTDDEATYQPVYLTLPTVPAAPVLSSPADEATNVATDATFSWAAADRATQYEIFFSTDSSFNNYYRIHNDEIDDGTSYQADNDDVILAPNTTYYWRVQAINEDGLTMSTATRSFTTAPAVTRNISTCEELQDIDQSGTDYDNFNLTQDIDCSNLDVFRPLYNSSENGYAGVFDGHGHTISGLNIDTGGDSYSGLFAYTAEGAQIKNLTLHDGQVVNGSSYAGALIGYAENTVVTNVHSDMDVDSGSSYAGGLIGYLYAYYQFHSIVQDSGATGDVNGDYGSGGLIGYTENEESNITVRRSYATGDVNSNGSDDAGGLIGQVNNYTYDIGYDVQTLISDTYADGGTINAVHQAGGLIGLVGTSNDEVTANANVTIERSYSSGTATVSNDNVGGLVGYVQDDGYDGDSININDSFSTTVVDPGSGENGHSIIGNIDASNIILDHVVYDWTASDANSTCWGADVSSECTGLEGNSYFKNNSTGDPFRDADSQVWDFTNVWEVRASTYPGLRGVTLSDATTADLTSAESSEPIQLSETGCLNISQSSSSKESSLNVQDTAYDYLAGFVGFTLNGCSTGATANISLTFVGSFDPAKVTIRKYNTTNHTYTTLTSANSGLSLSATTLGGKAALQISYHITDGGPLDQDGLANASITDPVGVATLVVSAPNTGFGGTAQ